MTAVTDYLSRLASDFGAAWNRFWFTPRDARGVCLLRILTGILATYFLVSHTPDLLRWFGPGGLLPVETVRQLIGGNASEFTFRPSYLNQLQSPSALWTVHLVAILIAVAFTLGIFTRLTNVLTLLAVLAYIHRAPMITGQFEAVLTMLLCYLVLAPSGVCWSLDRRLRGATKEVDAMTPSLGASLSTGLIRLHTCGFCVVMGLTMLAGQVWWNGEAVWWLIARPDSRLVDLTWLHGSVYAINLWTHAIVLFLLAFPLLIWKREARPMLLAFAVIFWLSLGLLTGLLAFCAAMLVASLAFLPRDFLPKPSTSVPIAGQ
jgi:hypothetical protein